MQMGVPALRRAGESTLVFEYGFEPEAVTTLLDMLCGEDYIGGRNIVLGQIPSRGVRHYGRAVRDRVEHGPPARRRRADRPSIVSYALATGTV